MTPDSKLARKIENGDFILTAEYLPRTFTDDSKIEAVIHSLGDGPVAVNAGDNPCGVVMSSLASCIALSKAGIEPVYQIVTRDRNRIALQSDLIGAVYLGIKNVLCLSGYHQTLTGYPESANVYDIDSIQLVAAVSRMCNESMLLDNTAIEGTFSMLVGAAANPYLTPLELNIIRLTKKMDAGARFIQTQPVFDTVTFRQWLDAAGSEGITEKTAILAGILPLENASEAERLRNNYTSCNIPDSVIERLKAAGDNEAQKKEGLAICTEIINEIKKCDNLRGVHIFSGGKESIVPELLASSGLKS